MNSEPAVEQPGTSDERMRILRMLRAGKITAEDAARLLDAVEGPRPGAAPQAGAAAAASHTGTGPSSRRPEPPGAGPGAAIAEEIKRVVDDIVRTFPRESLDDLGDAIRDSVREVLRGSREVTRAWRHAGRAGFGHHLVHAVLSGGEATAPFHDTRETTATRLRFRNTRGDVRFVTSPDGKVHISARRRVRTPDAREAERLAERIPIDIYEDAGTFVVTGPGARPFHERIRVDFELAVPEQMQIEAAVVRGDVTVEVTAGPVTVSTVKGDIAIEDCTRAVAQATRGTVAIQRSRGDITIEVTRGDVFVAQAEGEIAVACKRGDVSVRGAAVRALRVQTYRGDVSIGLDALLGGATGTISTLHGDVTVQLDPAVRCRIEASTVSGDLDCTLPLHDVSSDRRRLTGVLNAVDAHLRISTSHGDVLLRPLVPGRTSATTPDR